METFNETSISQINSLIMTLDEKLARLDELFGSYKAEWLNEKIFQFFATPSYFTSLKDKRPCVLMGGRGTGKTTV